MWWLYALLSAFFAALTAIFAKIGIKGIDSNLATALRTVVVLILAWGIAYFKGGLASMAQLTQRNLLFLFLSGLGTGLSWIFYFKALQLGNASSVAAVDKLSVALVIFMSLLFLGESFDWKVMLGAAMIIAGGMIIIY